MRHLAGHDRAQTLLLPEALDDYVGHDNPVHFIDAFVDGLDLAAAGFVRQTPKSTGRPGYAPAFATEPTLSETGARSSAPAHIR
jgi:hypothetical protein